jgi:hypothetical protein
MCQATSDPGGSQSDVSCRLLPGSDRQRRPRTYHYRLIFRNALAKATGCVMLWEVSGGRLPYQVAWERTEAGASRLHCTCADFVYRGEDTRHTCKHVRGLLTMSYQKWA